MARLTNDSLTGKIQTSTCVIDGQADDLEHPVCAQARRGRGQQFGVSIGVDVSPEWRFEAFEHLPGQEEGERKPVDDAKCDRYAGCGIDRIYCREQNKRPSSDTLISL